MDRLQKFAEFDETESGPKKKKLKPLKKAILSAAIKGINQYINSSDLFKEAASFGEIMGKQAGIFYRDIAPVPIRYSAEIDGLESSREWPSGVARVREPRLLTRLFASDNKNVPVDVAAAAYQFMLEDRPDATQDFVNSARKLKGYKDFNVADAISMMSARALNKSAPDYSNTHSLLFKHPGLGGDNKINPEALALGELINKTQSAKPKSKKPKLTSKSAAYRSLGTVPAGTGPQQMHNALTMLNQAKALVNPEDAISSEVFLVKGLKIP